MKRASPFARIVPAFPLALASLASLAAITIGCGGSSTNDAPATDSGTNLDAISDAPSDTQGDAPSDGSGGCVSDVTATPGTVVTDRGAVTGSKEAATWSFKGIPYAAPPIDALRWKPPAMPSCWTGARDATSFGSVCLQPNTARTDVVGSEDCLTLNVWTPAVAPADGKPLPVLFFIHGGSNYLGSSAQVLLGTSLYDGVSLATKGHAVVVTINYRLGIQGFFAHSALAAEDPHGSTGNYALLDQIAALQWVQRNAAAFGGDPKRVLVFGESAGATDTGALVASPLTRGLFSAALMESGGYFERTSANARAYSTSIVATAGCAGAADTIACMRALPAATILKSTLGKPEYATKDMGYPSVDGYVLPNAPLQLVAAGVSVPVVVGSNTEEYAAFVPPGEITEATLRSDIAAAFGSASDAVLAQYPIADYGGSPAATRVAIGTDALFTCEARRFARAALTGGAPAVYRYVYAHAYVNAPEPYKSEGAYHAAELAFVFDRLTAIGYPASTAELALADSIGGYWARFGATGDPSGAPAIPWPKYDRATEPHLRLDETIATGAAFRGKLCDFWDAQPPTLK